MRASPPGPGGHRHVKNIGQFPELKKHEAGPAMNYIQKSQKALSAEVTSKVAEELRAVIQAGC